jgi:hypothetical protein
MSLYGRDMGHKENRLQTLAQKNYGAGVKMNKGN